ncbi:hypothetical protein HY041_03755 [Candidatus Roizmanbacteria bacterium]|nr:hypothetical protein [Candidatus Roizmanbacteria bacterium]
MKRKIIIGLILLLTFLPFLLTFRYFSRAKAIKANIVIDVTKTLGHFPDRWKALAQGGEEKGRMLENVVSQIAGLYPKYIRLDHIYDYYDVVSRDAKGNLVFNWNKLNETVCDIYRTGAKPFFSLGYMPSVLSSDGSLISKPKDWNEWSLVVQKTIEHYSGQSSRLCGQITGVWKTDIYYEVWNEPDLETFGKWSLYGGEKDYKLLYSYSSLGAQNAKHVNRFLLGGPVTTALYKNWIQVFLDYVTSNKLRLDFLSWHHYSKKTDDYTDDMINLNEWLSPKQYRKYQQLPRIISEWGYDSDPNPIADTNVGAAHTIAAIRNFINYGFEMAFLFEIKDGSTPRWGIITHDGKEKPRYHALKLFNLLEGKELQIQGEGTYISALATLSDNKTAIILVNYDEDNKNIELTPVTLTNLDNDIFTITIHYLEGDHITIPNVQVTNRTLRRDILMQPNTVIALELSKTSTTSQ